MEVVQKSLIDFCFKIYYKFKISQRNKKLPIDRVFLNCAILSKQRHISFTLKFENFFIIKSIYCCFACIDSHSCVLAMFFIIRSFAIDVAFVTRKTTLG